jgi:hypothetical protein
MIDAVLKSGAEFLILWEIYDNEPQGSKSMATDMGFGLIRRDGTEMVLYSELRNMLTGAGTGKGGTGKGTGAGTGGTGKGTGTGTGGTGTGSGTETLSKNIVTSEYFESLGTVTSWLYFENGVAYGAEITNLKKNFTPLPGWVLHTDRVKGGSRGDKIAYRGETISLYVPDGMPAFEVLK